MKCEKKKRDIWQFMSVMRIEGWTNMQTRLHNIYKMMKYFRVSCYTRTIVDEYWYGQMRWCYIGEYQNTRHRNHCSLQNLLVKGIVHMIWALIDIFREELVQWFALSLRGERSWEFVVSQRDRTRNMNKNNAEQEIWVIVRTKEWAGSYRYFGRVGIFFFAGVQVLDNVALLNDWKKHLGLVLVVMFYFLQNLCR